MVILTWKNKKTGRCITVTRMGTHSNITPTTLEITDVLGEHAKETAKEKEWYLEDGTFEVYKHEGE